MVDLVLYLCGEELLAMNKVAQISDSQRKTFFTLSQVWVRGKILSPHEESNLRPLDSTLQCSTTEPQRLYG